MSRRQEPGGPPTCCDVSLPAGRSLGTPADRHLLAHAEALGWPAVRVTPRGVRHTRSSPRAQPCRGRSHPDGRPETLSTRRPAGSPWSSPRLHHGRQTRDGGVASPSPPGTCPRQETPSFAWRDNAHAQRRGPQYHQPQTEPPSCTPPLFPPSGYSRRGERSPRRCFRTVRAGFLAHGSSVIRPLSWAPCRAGDRHGRASPWRVIPPSLHGGRTAAAARLVPITSLAPAPRQPLHGLSPRRWLLGPSHHRGVSGGHLRTDAASCILGASAMPAA
jgi:hypothetical protein